MEMSINAGIAPIVRQQRDRMVPVKEQAMNQGRYKRLFVFVVTLLILLPLRVNALDPSKLFKQGTAYLEQGKLELAVVAFTRAIKENASYVEAYNNRALAYYAQGKDDRAKADLLKALLLDPDNEIANSNLGILLFEEEDYEDAITHLERAIGNGRQLKPYHAAILRNLAFIYQRVGLQDKAEISIKTALAIEQSYNKDKVAADRYTETGLGTNGPDHVLVLKVWSKR